MEFESKWLLTDAEKDEFIATLTPNLPALRTHAEISQEELATAVNVTRQTIISLENGKYNASLILAHDIAVYFGKTIEEIFLFEED